MGFGVAILAQAFHLGLWSQGHSGASWHAVQDLVRVMRRAAISVVLMTSVSVRALDESAAEPLAYRLEGLQDQDLVFYDSDFRMRSIGSLFRTRCVVSSGVSSGSPGALFPPSIASQDFVPELQPLRTADFAVSSGATLTLRDGTLHASSSATPLTCRQLVGYEVDGELLSGHVGAPDATVTATAEECPAHTLSYKAYSGTLSGLIQINNPLRFDANSDCRITRDEFAATLLSVNKEVGSLEGVLWAMLSGSRDYSIDQLRTGFDGVLSIQKATAAGSGQQCNDDGSPATPGAAVHNDPAGVYKPDVRTKSTAPFSLEVQGSVCNLWFGMVTPRKTAASGFEFHSLVRVRGMKAIFGVAKAPITIKASSDPVADLVGGGDGTYVTGTDTITQLSEIRCAAVRELPSHHPQATSGVLQRGPEIGGSRCKAGSQETFLQIPASWQLEDSFSPTFQLFTAAADRDRSVPATKLFTRNTLERQLRIYSVQLPGFTFERDESETDACLVFLFEVGCTMQCFSHCLHVLENLQADVDSPPIEYFGDLFELGNFSAKYVTVATREQKPERLNRKACQEATTYAEALDVGASCLETKTLAMKWDPLFSAIGIGSLEVYELNLDEIQGMSMSRWVRKVAQPFLLYVSSRSGLCLSSSIGYFYCCHCCT